MPTNIEEEHMTNPKSQIKKTKGSSLGSYNFDTSNYVIIKSDVRRDAHTGRLMSHKGSKKSSTAATSD